jgi:prefoldin subunit 5
MTEKLKNEEINSDVLKMKDHSKIKEIEKLDKINNLDYLCLNSLSDEEIKNEIEEIKKFYEKSMQEIEKTYKELNTYEEKINQLTSNISTSLEDDVREGGREDQQNLQNQQNLNHAITSSEDSMNEMMISQLKSEINSLKRKHNKKFSDLQKEKENALQENLSQIRDEYNLRIREFNETHDKSIKNLQEEIFELKREVEDVKKEKLDKENQGLTIARYKHEEILSEIKNVKIF